VTTGAVHEDFVELKERVEAERAGLEKFFGEA
jgi:hypothetical protein